MNETEVKTCDWCKQEKPLGEFARMRRSPDGRQRTCRRCFAINWRRNHNIVMAAPKRRRSPYDVIAGYLLGVERAISAGDAELALETIAKARKDMKL